nr:MAG TPA: hypothetical protein [Caudoviricetes sp.]DAN12535.1 MAG TPA: hypothetical protein [Bacteriophage sp.]
MVVLVISLVQFVFLEKTEIMDQMLPEKNIYIS